MNPLLTHWLARYADTSTQWQDEQEAEALRPGADTRTRAGRPAALQFTMTPTGILRDHAGTRLGYTSELSPSDLRMMGLNPDALTARQRRTPVPRRNPQTTRTPDPVLENLRTAYAGATTLPEPAMHADELLPVMHQLNAIPADAAPGDVVLMDGAPMGTVALTGTGDIRVIPADGGPMLTPGEQIPRLAIVDETHLNDAAGTVNTAIASNMEAMRAALTTIADPAPALRATIRDLRNDRDALRERLRNVQDANDVLRETISTTTDPGPVEAATAAAKAWKETGISDSVAKLASFKHLLETLDRLAQ